MVYFVLISHSFRSDNQRDEALQNVDELNGQLAEYRAKTTEKIRKVGVLVEE